MIIINKVKNLKVANTETFLSWDFNTLKSSVKRDTSKLENAIIKSGWSFPVIVWNKQSMVMGRQDYHWKHEPCLYGWKDGASHLWNSDRKQTTVLNFDRPNRNAEHPTMKPIELFAYQITNNTKGEDIIFDNFLGSGTTIIAAEKTGRVCYGIELDPKYVDVIIQRYVDYVENHKVIKNNTDDTHNWTKTQKENE